VVSRELRQRQFKALHWAGPSLDISTHILWHKDKWVSPAMAAFVELVREKLEDSEAEAAEGQLEHPAAANSPMQPGGIAGRPKFRGGKRPIGVYKGQIKIGPGFFEPLPEEELAAWEGAANDDLLLGPARRA
jgi:hypothetical protein